MYKLKVLRLNSILLPISEFERGLFKKNGINELVEIEGETPEEILKEAESADVICVSSSNLRRDVIEKLKKCKIICRYGTGVDRIDIAAATEKGIIVTNVPDFSVSTMAEHTFALILCLARKIPFMYGKLKSGEWISAKNSTCIHLIAGKTLGLVGFGNIAQEVAKKARAFNMEVIDFHRNVNPEIEKQYGVRPVSFEELLTESDFIVLLCPLSPETKGLIGKKEIEMMKESAILINMARGQIVDEMALADALKQNRIAGAGLDVLSHIDLFKRPQGPIESPFFELDNAILTPHCGGTSIEGGQDCLTKAISDIGRVLNGIWPKYCVNSDVKPWFKIGRID